MRVIRINHLDAAVNIRDLQQHLWALESSYQRRVLGTQSNAVTTICPRVPSSRTLRLVHRQSNAVRSGQQPWNRVHENDNSILALGTLPGDSGQGFPTFYLSLSISNQISIAHSRFIGIQFHKDNLRHLPRSQGLIERRLVTGITWNRLPVTHSISQ